MKTDTLITIGMLSKITHVHKKALEYYDKIGILPPTYVDDENGYRYYSAKHIYLVEAIRECAELSIPLKQLKNFISEDGSQIDLLPLMDLGTTFATARLKEVEQHLDTLKSMKEEISYSEDFLSQESLQYATVSEKTYWLTPYAGNQVSTDYHVHLAQTKEQMRKLGIVPGYEAGMLTFWKEGQPYSYSYQSIDKKNANIKKKQVVVFPETTFALMKSPNTNHQAVSETFERLRGETYEKAIFQAEIFAKKYDFESPLFEMKSTLPEASLLKQLQQMV